MWKTFPAYWSQLTRWSSGLESIKKNHWTVIVSFSLPSLIPDSAASSSASTILNMIPQPMLLLSPLSMRSWRKINIKSDHHHLIMARSLLRNPTLSIYLQLQTPRPTNSSILNSRTICKGSTQSPRTKPLLIGGGLVYFFIFYLFILHVYNK